jgi:CDP-glucose 4,6-dehydratase
MEPRNRRIGTSVEMSIDLAAAFGGQRVLVTGHTGFKGSWLCVWLLSLGADVHGVALAPSTEPSLFDALGLAERMHSSFIDIRNGSALRQIFEESQPAVVFHLAAQPLVRKSYDDPISTFETNVLGTANLLEACRGSGSVEAVVCVTTDKVYLSKEWPWPYRENDQLGGLDPYSASKACAELVAYVYQRNLKRPGRPVRIATARGGNVIGGGDWSNDRIVPDIVRALTSQQSIELRNPSAVRPWQHVLELCEGYLELAARLMKEEQGVDDAWNFGPYASNSVTVQRLVDAMLSVWATPDHPVTVKTSTLHESQILRLDISKALYHLSWRPRLDIAETLSWTAEWYRAYYRKPAGSWERTIEQLRKFEELRN